MNHLQKRTIHLVVGPVLFLLCYLAIPESVFGSSAASGAVGTVAWMAYWWITAPVDFAVTGFLPIAVNALFQFVDMSAVIANYSSETIILLLGASILTVSWEETGLDKRIAAKLLSLIGSGMRKQVVLWFLISAALSAILPNAVVCATITPIAVSMLEYVGEGDIAKSPKGSLLLLTIVYAAGVGGLATPLGGAMNLVTVQYLEQVTGQEYMYTSWVVRFLPVMVVLVISNIFMLLKLCGKTDTLGGSKEYFVRKYSELPPMSSEEKRCLALFVIATALSFTRQLYQAYLPGLKPAYSFLICAILSFMIKRSDGKRLMRWKKAQGKMVWDLIYVFAGGLAAGTLMGESGAAEAIGVHVSEMNLSNTWLLVFVILLMTILLSDITSNTATAAVAMPIVVAITQGAGMNPIPYIYVASIGVNLSYMLPTSIRAIPVGYGLEPGYMLKRGVVFTAVVLVLMTVTAGLLVTLWPAFGTV